MLDAALKNLGNLDEHKAVLKRAFETLQSQPEITAVILGGSIAKGRVDAFSDIDLYVVVVDKSFDQVFARRDQIAQAVGRPIFSFLADHNPDGDHDHIVLYDNLIHVDFMYCRQSDLSPNIKWANVLLMKDLTGAIGQLLNDSKQANLAPPSPESVYIVNRKFWTWCWYTFGKIPRGELWEALADIHIIRSWAILPMLNWSHAARDEGYRRIEEKLNEGLRELFAATVPSIDADALYSTLLKEIELFVYLRDSVFARYNLTNDVQGEKLVIAGIHKAWQSFQKKR